LTALSASTTLRNPGAWRFAVLTVLAVLAFAGAGRAQEQPTEVEGLAGDPSWQQVGSFAGARGETALDLLSNEVFRESRTGDLFQDLGDLQIAFGADWHVIDTGLKANFKRRVVERHDALEPGAEVGPADLSRFQTINSALGKAQLGVDYAQNKFDPFAVGLQSEAGFVVTLAQTQPPRPLDEHNARRTHLGTTSEELHDYWNTHGVRFDRHILGDVGRGLVDFLGLIAGQIGSHFEDTEMGAQYFEGFVEPLTVWADLGVPLKPELFEGPDSALAPGDAVSYLVFLEVAPLSAGMDKWGAQINLKGFLRFLRETTIMELPNNQILLRVKNIAAQGVETTPLKIRPELRWYFIRYGYTFLADRFDNSFFRASQILYHVDLNNPRAREAFAFLLATGHKVRFKPLLEAAEAHEGVRILSNSYLDGRRREHSFLARAPAWFRADRRNVSVVKKVETPTETYREATHARYNTFRQTWGADRWRSARSVLTLQSERTPRSDQKPPANPPPGSLKVSTQLRDKAADPRKLAYLVGLLRGVLGLNVPTPGLEDLRPAGAPPREGATLSLDISLGREQIERLQALDDATVWKALAEFYLGPALIDAWSTPELRAYWRYAGPVRPKTGPAAADIGRRVDQWLERNPRTPRGIGQLPEEERGSRRLFLRASSFADRLHTLQRKSQAGKLCLPCWSGLYSDFQEATFLQLLLVRAGGGVGDGAVGYDASIWTDSMFRPTHISNGIDYSADVRFRSRARCRRPANRTRSPASPPAYRTPGPR
jgi:hypothetical protein